MADRHELAQRIAIATAAGDVGTLAALSIELLAALGSAEGALEALARADRARKDGQAERTRRSRNATSRDVTLQDVTERDVTLPSPPSPPLDPPAPPINPSSPPSPASSSSAPAENSAEFDAEQRLRGRLDGGGDRIVLRFLGRAGSDMRRAAWVGRLGALMDAPPHFTSAELAEGLEALMTEPEASWKPSVLKAWVRRVRSDATRAAAATGASSANGTHAPAGGSADDAGSMFAKLRTLVQTTDPVPGRQSRKFIRRADVAALGERVLEAFDRIGGADRFTDPDEKVGFVLRDFTREYGTLTGGTLASARASP